VVTSNRIQSILRGNSLLYALIWIAVILLVAAVAGVVYEALGTRRDARLHPPPGRMIDLGTHRLHVLEKGTGPITVLLEAGLMSTVLSWSGLQEELSKCYRVASYDRAGLGWSDLGSMPRTAERIVEELHLLLERAEITGPYVLVGHSFGGLTMPLFAARYPQDTLGVVLVDGVVPAEWNPPSEHDRKLTRIGAKVCRRAAVLSRVGIIRFVAFLLTTGVKKVAAHLVRLISRGTPAQSGTVSSPWFWALPANERAMAGVFWIKEKFALTIASQLENLPVSAAQLNEAGYREDKPTVFVSASTSPQRRREEHAALAKRLPLGHHVTAKESNHWIMQAQPELLVEAIRRIASASPDGRTAAATEDPLTYRASQRA
jgi:pimeloyl-ACP methyl ester carboxylesterase